MSNKPLVMTQAYKTYGETETKIEILKGADLIIEKGEFVMLLGPSGSGKSTLLHVTAGLTPLDQGSIDVCGVNIQKCNTNQILQLRRDKIGFVFQDFRLLQGLTAFENVLVPLYAQGIKPVKAKSRATELLKVLGLGNRMDHFPRKLSGGEMQRVGIARALANNPDLILADEPTGNLDQRLANEVVELLAGLPKKTGAAILMVTHNQQLIPYATKVIQLVNGGLEVKTSV